MLEGEKNSEGLDVGRDSAVKSADVRVQRIADYAADSLAKDNALEANLGVVNADLMLIAFRFRDVLEDVLQQPTETLAQMAEFMPGVDGYLKVVKQVDRFSQLAIKLQALNAAAPHG